MDIWNCRDALGRLLDMLLRYHPAPIRVLEGTMEPPEVADLVAEARGERREAPDLGTVGLCIEGAGFSSAVEEEAKILGAALDLAGGWSGVAGASREFREVHPEVWEVLRDHVKLVRPYGGMIRNGSALVRVAERHGVDPDSVSRWRARVPKALARIALAAAA